MTSCAYFLSICHFTNQPRMAKLPTCAMIEFRKEVKNFVKLIKVEQNKRKLINV